MTIIRYLGRVQSQGYSPVTIQRKTLAAVCKSHIEKVWRPFYENNASELSLKKSGSVKTIAKEVIQVLQNENAPSSEEDIREMKRRIIAHIDALLNGAKIDLDELTSYLLEKFISLYKKGRGNLFFIFLRNIYPHLTDEENATAYKVAMGVVVRDFYQNKPRSLVPLAFLMRRDIFLPNLSPSESFDDSDEEINMLKALSLLGINDAEEVLLRLLYERVNTLATDHLGQQTASLDEIEVLAEGGSQRAQRYLIRYYEFIGEISPKKRKDRMLEVIHRGRAIHSSLIADALKTGHTLTKVSLGLDWKQRLDFLEKRMAAGDRSSARALLDIYEGNLFDGRALDISPEERAEKIEGIKQLRLPGVLNQLASTIHKRPWVKMSSLEKRKELEDLAFTYRSSEAQRLLLDHYYTLQLGYCHDELIELRIKLALHGCSDAAKQIIEEMDTKGASDFGYCEEGKKSLFRDLSLLFPKENCWQSLLCYIPAEQQDDLKFLFNAFQSL